MSLNKNCFLFIQVMHRKHREDGNQTSPVSLKCPRGSSFVVGNMFVLVNPLTATSMFSPARAARSRGLHVSGSESRQAQNLPQGACYKAMHIVPPCQPRLVSNGKSHLVMDPLDVARRVVENNLRVVWCGSQRVCMFVSICVRDCKMWWNCGWNNITQFF
jgi:hypothetical protein